MCATAALAVDGSEGAGLTVQVELLPHPDREPGIKLQGRAAEVGRQARAGRGRAHDDLGVVVLVATYGQANERGPAYARLRDDVVLQACPAAQRQPVAAPQVGVGARVRHAVEVRLLVDPLRLRLQEELRCAQLEGIAAFQRGRPTCAVHLDVGGAVGVAV